MIVEVRIAASDIPPDADPLIELRDHLEEAIGPCVENGFHSGYRYMLFELEEKR